MNLVTVKVLQEGHAFCMLPLAIVFPAGRAHGSSGKVELRELRVSYPRIQFLLQPHQPSDGVASLADDHHA
jgi:hypothetical protein